MFLVVPQEGLHRRWGVPANGQSKRWRPLGGLWQQSLVGGLQAQTQIFDTPNLKICTTVRLLRTRQKSSLGSRVLRSKTGLLPDRFRLHLKSSPTHSQQKSISSWEMVRPKPASRRKRLMRSSSLSTLIRWRASDDVYSMARATSLRATSALPGAKPN
jgi:hypothetical protein